MKGMERIKIVIQDNNAIGFIYPQTPTSFNVLHASILRGSSLPQFAFTTLSKNWRLANVSDFADYLQCPHGFLDPSQYEYDTTHHTVLEKIKIW